MVDAVLILSNVPALGAHGDPQTQRADLGLTSHAAAGTRESYRVAGGDDFGKREGQGSALALARAQLLACLEACTLAVLDLGSKRPCANWKIFWREKSGTCSSGTGFN